MGDRLSQQQLAHLVNQGRQLRSTDLVTQVTGKRVGPRAPLRDALSALGCQRCRIDPVSSQPGDDLVGFWWLIRRRRDFAADQGEADRLPPRCRWGHLNTVASGISWGVWVSRFTSPTTRTPSPKVQSPCTVKLVASRRDGAWGMR